MSEKTGPQLRATLISTNNNDTVKLGKQNFSRSYYTYQRMKRDPTIALARLLVCAPVVSSPWSYEASDKAPEGAVDFIQDEMDKHRIGVLEKCLRGWIDYGWAPFEKVKMLRSDGKIGFKKLKPLLQQLTDILVDVQTGEFRGLYQLATSEQEEVYLSIEESFTVAIDVEGTDWYGEAQMEVARETQERYEDVNDSASRYDRKVAGTHWFVHYPEGTTSVNGVDKDNYDVANEILAKLESSGGVAVPNFVNKEIVDLNAGTNTDKSSWIIEMKSPDGKGEAGFIDRLKYLDGLKVRAFGLPERSVLEGQFGTKAEAGAHQDFAVLNMQLNHAKIAEQLNCHCVDHLLVLNYGPEAKGTVKIIPAPIADENVKTLADVYKVIIGQPEGATEALSAIDMSATMQKLGIPEQEKQTPLDVPPSSLAPLSTDPQPIKLPLPRTGTSY